MLEEEPYWEIKRVKIFRDGKFLYICKSISMTAKRLNVSKFYIRRMIKAGRNGKPTTRGYTFERATEEEYQLDKERRKNKSKT